MYVCMRCVCACVRAITWWWCAFPGPVAWPASGWGSWGGADPGGLRPGLTWDTHTCSVRDNADNAPPPRVKGSYCRYIASDPTNSLSLSIVTTQQPHSSLKLVSIAEVTFISQNKELYGIMFRWSVIWVRPRWRSCPAFRAAVGKGRVLFGLSSPNARG